MNNTDVNIINGAIVGVHLGAPMQDATPAKPEDNEVYATERNTVTRIPNSVEIWDEQPAPSGGSGGGVTTLYYAGAETEFLWMNPDDVGNESKKLTYEDALKLKDHILRFCMIYGENIVTYTGKEFSHYPEEKYVFIDVNAEGVSFNIRG